MADYWKSLRAQNILWSQNLVSHFGGGTKTENRVLRKIFGPKRGEDGSWRKLHNDEFPELYSLPNIFRVIK
jgi:hypothetical protein